MTGKPRFYQLVSSGGKWQVCSKARRIVRGNEEIVWIYGDERLAFCLAAEADVVMPLPSVLPDKTNFYGDSFTFAIDEIDQSGMRMEKIAGANNISAAHACFDELVYHRNTSTILQLRQAGHIIRAEFCLGSSHEHDLETRRKREQHNAVKQDATHIRNSNTGGNR